MSAFWISKETATWRVVDEEAVVIHMPSSSYFSLNRTGTLIWTQLAERAHSVTQMNDWLSRATGRPSADTAADVDAFFGQLRDAGFLSDGQPPAPIGEASPAGAAYEPPRLIKFGDLETLILSGE